MNRATTLIYRLYKSPFVRFAAVGAVATGINYGTYTLLILHFDDLWPEVAYIAAFCVSIICNFILSSYFTFSVDPTWSRAAKFLTAHLVNLANELLLLRLWLWIGVPKLYAPLCVFVITFPINYLMVRLALRGRASRPTEDGLRSKEYDKHEQA